MTYAELLRKYATDATNEGGMWFSGEYMTVLASIAESLEAENAKLRKLAQRMWRLERFGCYGCRRECDAESCYANDCKEAVEIEQEMRALGIEVPR